MAKRRKRSPAKAVQISYHNGDVVVHYVARAPSEVRKEYARVLEAVNTALRGLKRLKRIRHDVIVSARFQLANSVHPVPVDATPEHLADEVGRLSYVMEDTHALLGRLKNSRLPLLEEIRFTLTYGQTPKRKDGPGVYGRKSSLTRDYEPSTTTSES